MIGFFRCLWGEPHHVENPLGEPACAETISECSTHLPCEQPRYSGYGNDPTGFQTGVSIRPQVFLYHRSEQGPAEMALDCIRAGSGLGIRLYRFTGSALFVALLSRQATG